MSEEMKWRPISSAPKDGTEILIYVHGQVAVASWIKELGWFDGQYGNLEATHWMPLPAPPKEVE